MESEPISSLDLMERAGSALAAQLQKDVALQEFPRIFVFCGPGNNGGDGLVIARKLAENGFYVTAVAVIFDRKTTEEFEVNKQRFLDITPIHSAEFSLYGKPDDLIGITEGALCIDALFGIGLHRPLEGEYLRLVDSINHQFQFQKVVAVDIPSGMFTDTHLPAGACCVRADITYTFQFGKWSFLIPSYEALTGRVSVLDIKMKKKPAKQGETPIGIEMSHIQVMTSEAAEIFARRLDSGAPFSHKGTFGHGLLIAGSKKMPGAAILSARAAMRSGLGKLTVHTTSNVAAALPIALPEAIIDPDNNENSVSSCRWEEIPGLRAIAIGPGIGKSKEALTLLKNLLDEVQTPVIFDADALNLLAENKTLLAYLPPYSILTPHVGEFDRLAGPSESDYERMLKAGQFAIKHNVIVILKGHVTVVACPYNLKCTYRIMESGNVGMATAGSGDVLTGILLGLLTRTNNPAFAAQYAPYIHGVAGTLALDKESVESLIASDIIDNIGRAFNLHR